MSGFAADWLHTREPFDAAARDNELARRFAIALSDGRDTPRRIIDLAAGSGASFRALAQLIGGDQDWLLVDNDPLLIAAQAAEIARWSLAHGWHCEESRGGVWVRTGSAVWRARSQTVDLSGALEQIRFAACHGATMSAFLDLVSAAWLERLCAVLARSSLPLLATLSVDGRRVWHPSLPADADIDRAFRQHQSRDKGFGPAQGGLAAAYLAARLTAEGYAVDIARSDWRIGAGDREMLLHMVEESAAVAHDAEPETAHVWAAWLAERRAQVDSGALSLEVGHLDLLAVAR
jgi:hypothetical protein